MGIGRFLVNVRADVALASFMILVSRKFTELQEISCVNLMDGTTPFRYSMKVVSELLFPFQIRKMSSMKRTQSIM